MSTYYIANHGKLEAQAATYGSVSKILGTKYFGQWVNVTRRTLSYRFNPHFLPFVDKLTKELIEKGLPGLLAMDERYKEDDKDNPIYPRTSPIPDDAYYLHEPYFIKRYGPNEDVVEKPYPVKMLDFAYSGAYSTYLWELFYHVPFMIAVHLSKRQRHEEALDWFHHIFDPGDNSQGPEPARFWKVKPFQTTEVKSIEKILVNLSTQEDTALFEATLKSIDNWSANPFKPHVVARYRPSAYMYKTVMAYLDNLIGWGDGLFRQDTGESIDEALIHYVQAKNILGPEPQIVPQKGTVKPQTYASLQGSLDAFSNALVDLESDVLFDLSPDPATGGSTGSTGPVDPGSVLYFCVPRNEKLLGYWRTVDDRLYKIHNSLNLQGVFRQLPLFAAPIDPALLAKAAAAGVDISAAIAGLDQPLPLVRFQALVQKASELAQEVKSLGGQLLSAMEKEEAEHLAVMRARQESLMLTLGEMIKYGQYQESIKNRENTGIAVDLAIQKYRYYSLLLGSDDAKAKLQQLDDIEVEKLEKFKFRSKEKRVDWDDIDVDVVKNKALSQGRMINTFESVDLTMSDASQLVQTGASVLEVLSGVMNTLPSFSAQAEPLGIGASISYGGSNIGAGFSAGASAARGIAALLSYGAQKAGKLGSYTRREQDWQLQKNLAAQEYNQGLKQLRAAQIREALAEREWKNHQQQIANAQAVEQYLTDERTGKKTKEALYGWQKREVRALYEQCFDLAFSTAKKAERALQHELGDPYQSFIQYGYQGGMEGLLAGEKLHLDIKRMETAYQDLNAREHEMTKNISLLQLDPLQLIALRDTGSCTINIPEAFFDLESPGHYFRRIKTMAISIPSVSGPYTSVNCRLTLSKSRIRKDSTTGDEYAMTGDDDYRFSVNYATAQSIVTSSGMNDSGMFEVNLRDERFLPFEGHGAISEWKLELMQKDLQPFDRNSISDVILHMRYTARDGGEALATAANTGLDEGLSSDDAIAKVRLFSVRHEFPSAWAQFKAAAIPANGTASLSFTLTKEHYPFWADALMEEAESATVVLLALPADGAGAIRVCANANDTTTANSDGLEVWDATKGNGLVGTVLAKVPKPAPVGSVSLNVSNNAITDLWLAVNWKKA